MIKYIIVLTACFFLHSTVNAQAKDCSTIKNGVFKSILELDGDTTVTIIKRKGNKQVEEVPSLGLIMEFTVKWTSECTYELTKPKVTKGELADVDDSQVISVKVLDVRDDSFTAEVISNFSDVKLMVSFLRIKKN